MKKRYLVIRPIVFLGSTVESGAYLDMPEWEAKNIGIGKFLQEEAPAEKAESATDTAVATKTPEELEAEKAEAEKANAEKEAGSASASAGDGSEAGAGSQVADQ